jgi:hypothetical protein
MTNPTNEKLSSKIDSGVRAAIAEAIERHRKLGESISIWKSGKVVTLKADEIPPLNSDKAEIIYPESDGKPMADNTQQFR